MKNIDYGKFIAYSMQRIDEYKRKIDIYTERIKNEERKIKEYEAELHKK